MQQEIPFGYLDIGNWMLFGIWNLVIGILEAVPIV
jgi:hypothetical protein